MGDRANVAMITDGKKEPIFFYTHWSGSQLPHIVKAALEHKQRWDDPAYLARIVFCEMVAASDSLKGETGYGISHSICDNDGYPVVVVNPINQTVGFEPADGDYRQPRKVWPFVEYVKLTEEVIDSHYNGEGV